jgi:hypothetical protein
MKVRVSLVIKSHLNDAMMEIGFSPETAKERLHFVKYLVHMFPYTDEEIDVDVVYEQFELGYK